MSRILTGPLLYIFLLASPAFGAGQAVNSTNDPATNTAPPEVRFVAAGISDARGKLRRAQADVYFYKVTYKELLRAEETQPAAPGQLDDKVEIQAAYWAYRDPDLAMDIRDIDPFGSLLREKQLLANTGSIRTLFTGYEPDAQGKPPVKPAVTGLVLPADQGMRNGLPDGDALMDPRSWAFFENTTPLDRLFLDKREHATFQGEDVIDRSRCMKIQLDPNPEERWLYWIDVEHGFVVRRQEVYTYVKGQAILSSKQEALRLSESGGVWLPTVIESRVFFPTAGLPGFPVAAGPSATMTGVFLIVTISGFRTDLESVPSTVFSLAWPPGTAIHDLVTGKNYITGSVPQRKGNGTGVKP